MNFSQICSVPFAFSLSYNFLHFPQWPAKSFAGDVGLESEQERMVARGAPSRRSRELSPQSGPARRRGGGIQVEFCHRSFHLSIFEYLCTLCQ